MFDKNLFYIIKYYIFH